MKKYYVFIALLSVLVLVLIVGGVKLVGTPIENRDKEADRVKVDQIQLLTQGIEKYYQNNKKLPTTLDDVSIDPIYQPIAKESYTYKVASPTEYVVCATFSTDQSKDTSKNHLEKNSGQYKLHTHSAGENCINFMLPDYAADVRNQVKVVPIKGTFSNLSATLLENSSQFNFEYSGMSHSYTVEMSTFPDFSENVYLTFATGPKSPLITNKGVVDYADYYCGKVMYWRVKADLGVVSEATESVVCGVENITPTLPLPIL